MKNPNDLKQHYGKWEVIKDLIDQCIDIMLNLRQSGHPGGSRSKVHGMVTTLLSGAMRWDIRDAGKVFSDRYVLVAGHTNPVVYATLAVLNEALRIKYKQTKHDIYTHQKGPDFQLTWEDLITLRNNKGLPGHAEMEGKTLFFKFNTGPSGHGSPAAAGEALALKYANVSEVKVFAFEGEGGLTTGASHETMNSAWGLGLGNLVYFLDWNDFGIDARPFSSIVYGTPEDWFGSHGWHVEGTTDVEDWEELTSAYYKLLVTNADPNTPKVIYGKGTKGRGYHKSDYASHGSPHKRNSELFWKTKEDFAQKNVDLISRKDYESYFKTLSIGMQSQQKTLIKKLIEMLQESDLIEIEIQEGEDSVRISRGIMKPIEVQSVPIESNTVDILSGNNDAADNNSGSSIKSPIAVSYTH